MNCNAVHITKGKCILPYGHKEPHRWEKEEAINRLTALIASGKISTLADIPTISDAPQVETNKNYIGKKRGGCRNHNW